MIADIITGDAVIHGIPTNGSAITLTGVATFVMEKAEAEHMFGSYFTTDNQGNDIGATAFNEHADVTVDFTPIGATRAAVALIAAFPAPLSSMSMANLQVNGSFLSTGVYLFNTTLLYIGGARITLSALIAGKVTGLKMRTWANAAQNALMTTQVIG
jgi:hypothetical protein